jgi:hypothetical protein
MQQRLVRLVNPLEIPAKAAGNGRQPREGYRPPFEELWWEAGPAVLSALGSAGDRIPQRIAMRLQHWIALALSENPVAALDLGALDQAFRDLSTFHLASHAYSLPTDPAPLLPHADRVVMTDRGYAFAVGKAQECVARIACALHGQAGARTILAAIGRERDLRRQIVEMMERLR